MLQAFPAAVSVTVEAAAAKAVPFQYQLVPPMRNQSWMSTLFGQNSRRGPLARGSLIQPTPVVLACSGV